MKKTLVIFVLLCLASFAQAQMLTAHTADVQYRICRVGSGSRKVAAGCHVQLLVTAKTQRGQEVFNQNTWLAIGDEPQRNSLVGALTVLSQGDSAEIVMPARMFFAAMVSYPRTRGVQPNERLSVHVRVLRVVEPDIVLDDDYDQFLAEYTAYENSMIGSFLRGNQSFRATGDIWKRQERAGNGTRTSKFGDVMMIAYEGKFLNGTTFDTGAKAAEPFRYVRGQQWQVVQGMALALSAMSEGERATFVMPSKSAFGVRGLADIVPPFTPVIYEVEVVKINIR